MFGFEDVIGQKDVVGRLKAEVEQGRTAHALLLTGPRGAGKLPLALALARGSLWTVCLVSSVGKTGSS